MEVGTRKPPVITWLMVYAVGLAILYLAAAGLFVFLFAVQEVPDSVPDTVRFVRFGFVAVCAALSIGFLAMPFLPQRRWVWTYGLTLIALGFTSLLTVPASIALLVYWIKPEVKAYYSSGDQVL